MIISVAFCTLRMDVSLIVTQGALLAAMNKMACVHFCPMPVSPAGDTGDVFIVTRTLTAGQLAHQLPGLPGKRGEGFKLGSGLLSRFFLNCHVFPVSRIPKMDPDQGPFGIPKSSLGKVRDLIPATTRGPVCRFHGIQRGCSIVTASHSPVGYGTAKAQEGSHPLLTTRKLAKDKKNQTSTPLAHPYGCNGVGVEVRCRGSESYWLPPSQFHFFPCFTTVIRHPRAWNE